MWAFERLGKSFSETVNLEARCGEDRKYLDGLKVTRPAVLFQSQRLLHVWPTCDQHVRQCDPGERLLAELVSRHLLCQQGHRHPRTRGRGWKQEQADFELLPLSMAFFTLPFTFRYFDYKDKISKPMHNFI